MWQTMLFQSMFESIEDLDTSNGTSGLAKGCIIVRSKALPKTLISFAGKGAPGIRPSF